MVNAFFKILMQVFQLMSASKRGCWQALPHCRNLTRALPVRPGPSELTGLGHGCRTRAAGLDLVRCPADGGTNWKSPWAQGGEGALAVEGVRNLGSRRLGREPPSRLHRTFTLCPVVLSLSLRTPT